MTRYVAALQTVIGDQVTVSLHPDLLEKVLGDAAPGDVLTVRSSRGTGELEQQSAARDTA